MKYSSELLETAVRTFARLPGIGQKTALRTILYLAQRDRGLIKDLVESLTKMDQGLAQCEICHNLSDSRECSICTDRSRDKAMICVVSNTRDVMALEETDHYRGMYHILGGVISPIDGIGPDQLNIESLVKRVTDGEVKEVIMAINPTIEGETTIYYISRKLRELGVEVSILARGISFGGELEYADELTLGRSIVARTPYRLSDEA